MPCLFQQTHKSSAYSIASSGSSSSGPLYSGSSSFFLFPRVAGFVFFGVFSFFGVAASPSIGSSFPSMSSSHFFGMSSVNSMSIT